MIFKVGVNTKNNDGWVLNEEVLFSLEKDHLATHQENDLTITTSIHIKMKGWGLFTTDPFLLLYLLIN